MKQGLTLKQGGRAYKSRLKRKNVAKWLLKSAGCKWYSSKLAFFFCPLTALYVFNTPSFQQAYDHPTMPTGQDGDSCWTLKASTLTETSNVTKLDRE